MTTLNLGRVAMKGQGTYDAATTYKILDVVNYNGGTYMYINDTAGSGHLVTDTDYWQQISLETATGAEIIAGTEAGKLVTPNALADALNVANGLLKLDTNGTVAFAQLLTNVANGLVKLDANAKVPASVLNIVGACADGAIIESGSNANGEYIKYANGTMICRFVATSSDWGFSPGSNIFYSSLSFAATFYDVPTILTEFCGSYADYIRTCCNNPTNSDVTVSVYNSYPTNAPVGDRNNTFHLIAVGRWKA